MSRIASGMKRRLSEERGGERKRFLWALFVALFFHAGVLALLMMPMKRSDLPVRVVNVSLVSGLPVSDEPAGGGEPDNEQPLPLVEPEPVSAPKPEPQPEPKPEPQPEPEPEPLPEPEPEAPQPVATPEPVQPEPKADAPVSIPDEPTPPRQEKPELPVTPEPAPLPDPEAGLQSALERLRSQVSGSQPTELERKLARLQKKVNESGPPSNLYRRSGRGSGGGGMPPLTPYDSYLSTAVGIITRNWSFSASLLRETGVVEAYVAITVGIDGSIQDITFDRPSVSGYFNQTVTKALERSSPLPVVPPDVSIRPMRIGLIFTPGGIE